MHKQATYRLVLAEFLCKYNKHLENCFHDAGFEVIDLVKLNTKTTFHNTVCSFQIMQYICYMECV